MSSDNPDEALAGVFACTHGGKVEIQIRIFPGQKFEFGFPVTPAWASLHGVHRFRATTPIVCISLILPASPDKA